MKSWRTSVLGICMILAAVGGAGKALLDGDPSTNVSFTELGIAISGGIALIFARDDKVSSESAGAK